MIYWYVKQNRLAATGWQIPSYLDACGEAGRQHLLQRQQLIRLLRREVDQAYEPIGSHREVESLKYRLVRDCVK